MTHQASLKAKTTWNMQIRKHKSVVEGPEKIQMKKRKAIRFREEEVDMEVGEEIVKGEIEVVNEGGGVVAIGEEVGEEEATPIIREQMPLRKWPCEIKLLAILSS